MSHISKYLAADGRTARAAGVDRAPHHRRHCRRARQAEARAMKASEISRLLARNIHALVRELLPAGHKINHEPKSGS
jgi:hypothetical protein